MKKLTSNEIRKMWLDFFKSKGHKIEKGASLIPYKDPTLLWINSGVAALKHYFDGSEVPPSRRITNVQKSIRTNDIENVGFTARHHTFFEMLGNFSIGDYFRKEVIAWATEILTSPKYFAMDKANLYMTYLPSDKDTYDNWIKNGIEPSHLIPLEGNFWQIGEGPCGPNTEVFYDRGEKYDPKHIGIKLLQDDIENDRYIEIWGIVFSQYNAIEGVKREDYKELPSKNIDTGAGLERIACILQETPTNFETDLFMPIIKATEKLATKPYKEPYLMAYRVIADHIRAVTFALLDGESFSNEGRGYVLRRLLRRAMRYGKKIGINRPFLCQLVPVVALIMEDFYPEFNGQIIRIAAQVKAEEEKFINTLSTGEDLLRSLVKDKKELSGVDAFKLYDTYGFPIDLTVEICAENNVKVDTVGFEKEMEAQKDRARNSRKELQSMKKQSKDLLECTVDSEFTYDNIDIDSEVVAMFIDGVSVDEISSEGDIIFKKTTFYAESGGQVSDEGIIVNKKCEAQINNVQKAPNKQHLHHVIINKGSIKLGDVFTLKIDHFKRELTKRNHTATHLLQEALEEVLGNHVNQQGSYVSSEYLRFDFNHFAKISTEQLKKIESIVNTNIAEAHPVDIKVLPIAEALKLGAKALFSEKYGDIVRVVIVDNVSKEFCGGTHVSNTKDIGIFKIETEESIASGIRRIQARTSLHAYELINKREIILDNAEISLGAASYAEIEDRLHGLEKQKDELKKNNERLLDKTAYALSLSYKNEFVIYNGYKVLIRHVTDARREGLLKIIDNLKVNLKDYVIVLIGGENNQVPVVVALDGTPLKDGLKAGNLVKEIATVVGGSGGGNPTLAFGQGKDMSKIQDALDKAKELLN